MDDAAPALRLNRTPQTLERLVYPWRAVGTGSDVGHHPGLNDLLPECCIQQGLRLRIRYAQQAIVVANHEVTGLDHHAIDGDGHIDFARAVLVGSAVRDARCEYREAASTNPCRVPDRSGRHAPRRSEEHTSELQSQSNLVCRLLLEKKKKLHKSWSLVLVEAPQRSVL